MKVLVTASSRHGATWEIAAAIARELERHGLRVETRHVEDVASLDGFDAVVLGSAVYIGKWLPEARAFAKSHAAELAARPTWLFSSGPIGDPPAPAPAEAVHVDDLVELTQARGHRIFAGKVDRGRLGFGERMVVRAVRAPDGDYRDWDGIAEWARAIAVALEPVPAG
jgi:menaquinone-dependent protoporphyrinogen oxidase